MKVKTLSVLAGVGTPLLLTAGAPAGFLGIKSVLKENAFGLSIYSIYAEFDRPGEDLFQAVTYVTEIVSKIVEVSREHGEDEDLFRLFADVNEMLSLQFESAKQIMEFHRMLTLVESPQGIHGKPKQREIRTDGSVAKLHHKNIESIKETIAEAETSIGEVNQNLATLMLQVTQMANRVSDLVTVAQFREETAQTLRSIQTVVDARRETVHELVRWITPERA